MKYTKICKHCGQSFETNSPQKIYCDRPHFRPCPVCSKPVQMIDNDFSRPARCCSSECAHKLRTTKIKPRTCKLCGETFTPTSGVSLVCSKIHYAICEICGTQYIQTLDRLRAHVTTCSDECTRMKMRKNSLAKYGVEYPMQNKEVQKHFHDAMKAKYGVEHALQIPGKVEQQQAAAYETNMKHSGVPYACLTENCQNAATHIRSKLNQEFADKLTSAGLTCELEKVVERKSYDIYLPESNTLIELDPTWTHNAYTNPWNSPVDKYYHRDKTNLALQHGYKCIHIFDWDRWNPIIDILSPTKRVYARNCTVYRIYSKYGDPFLAENHLQGTCRGQLLYLGLVYNDELLQLMTFGRPRYNKQYNVELLRLCTKSGYTVVGGASKLFSYATSEYGLQSIISYCDRSKFTGSVYEKMGMKLVRTTPPNKIWSKNAQKITANLLNARGYDQLFGTSYGKGTSNEQLMLDNGWLPVYDCGQAVYTFE